MIIDLAGLVEALEELKKDFDRLAEVTRSEDPMTTRRKRSASPGKEDPRYVLPVAEQKEAA